MFYKILVLAPFNLATSNMKKTFTLLTLLFFGTAMSYNTFAQCSSGESEVTVTIVQDYYGSETTWQLTGPGGTPVYGSGGPYSDNANGVSHTETFCVPVGTNATFKINDAYGDGICCNYGNGSYTIAMNECTVVATGAEFGQTQSRNFLVKERPAVDLAIESIDVKPVVPIGDVSIIGSVINYGSTAITSFDLNYSIDNGPTVTQSITGVNISGCASYNFNHATPWNATSGGIYSLKVWVSNVNGGLDTETSNDEGTQDVSIATEVLKKVPLVEELTSATCAPCASLNATFDPFLLNNVKANQASGGIAAAVKYQMNWPNPGTDPSYNGDGATRRSFYSTTGIPDEYIDGHALGAATSMTTYTNAAAKDAFVCIDLGYTVNGNTVDVTATVTPYAEFSGQLKLYIAVTEDHYTYNDGTTSQKEYYYVMRKMLPSGSGNILSNLSLGVPTSVSKSYTFSIGSPAQNNYELWGNMDGITVVAWVQNSSTHEIYQAAFVNNNGASESCKIVTGVEDLAKSDNNIGLMVYPNPFTNEATVVYDLKSSENITVDLFNVLGETVYSNNLGTQPVGQNSFTINSTNINSGIYFLSFRAGNNIVTERVVITK